MARPLLLFTDWILRPFPTGILIMAKKKNPHGIRARVSTTGVIELWLGEPGEAESDCIGQFNKFYLESVRDVLTMVNRLPVIETNMVYGMPREEAEYEKQESGFLRKGADKCPDCNVSLHWHQTHGMRLLEEAHGKQFYRARCPTCYTHWLVRK